MFNEILIIIFKILLIIIPLMISIAYLTYFERKVIGAIQLRKGPNVVGPFGLFQPIADGINYLLKRPFFLRTPASLFLLFLQYLLLHWRS